MTDKDALFLNESKIVDQGILYLNQKKYKRAQRELCKVLQLNPKNETARAHLGHVYLQQKNYSQAITQFQKLLELNPQSPYAHEGLALVYLEQEKLSLCQEELEYLKQLNHQDEHSHQMLGYIYRKQHKYELAIRELCKALETNPHNEFARENLIQIYSRQKRYALAKEVANELLKINPFNIQAYHELGNIYLEQKDYPQAITQFQKLLELNPQSPYAHEGLALVYLEQEKLSLCQEELEYLKQLNHQDEHSHQMLGYIYRKQHKYELAIRELCKALETNPHNEFARENLIQIYSRQKRYALAKEVANELLKINPFNIQAYHELGNIYLEEKDYPRAITRFKKALDLYTNYGHTQQELSYAYIDMGRTYLLMERYNKAIESFKKAMELNPDDKMIYKFLHRAYIETKKYNLAVDVVAKGYELSTKVPLREIPYKIKILRIPNFYGSDIFSTEMNSIVIPPLALGTIVAYIRSQGIPIDQDDLHIKTHYDNYFGEAEEKIDESVFFDIPKVIGYTNGKDDSQIERIMDTVSRKTDFQGYKIVLFSIDTVSMNSSHAMFALCLARYLKRKYNPIIILGGMNYFVELMRKNRCNWSDIDYVICNDGEKVVVDLLLLLLNNLPRHKGIVEEDKRVIYSTEVFRPVRPDFDGLPLDMYRYRGLKIDYCKDDSLRDTIEKFNQSRVFLLPFKFIKGCTNKCIFCESSLGGLKHVVPPSIVADRLQQLQARYNPTGYLFLSDTLNISKKYVDQLCDEIIKRKLKIRWSDCARVDRLDKDSIYKMREAGCIRLVFGMETASKRLLNYVNKGIDLKQLEEALYWSDRVGIWTGLELISGLPYEKEEDVDATISFIKHNREHIDALYYNAFYIKDSSILLSHSEKYGISNVSELLSYENVFGTFVKYSFDEINGLKWPEKRKQILSAFNKIMKTLGASPFPEHEYESFLFFLYANYPDKKVIKKLFYSVGKEKMEYLNALRRTKNSRGQDKRFIDRTLIYG
ncbi:tetratricopeptide repeat protein [Candidatus Omnitrophota bacterium]